MWHILSEERWKLSKIPHLWAIIFGLPTSCLNMQLYSSLFREIAAIFFLFFKSWGKSHSLASFPKYYMVTVILAYQFCQIPHLVSAVLYLSSTMVDFLPDRKKTSASLYQQNSNILLIKFWLSMPNKNAAIRNKNIIKILHISFP